MSKSYPIDYQFFKKGKTLLVGTVFLVLIQMTFFIIFARPSWLVRIGKSRSTFFQSLIWDRIIVEMIAVFVILRLLAFVGSRWQSSLEMDGAKIIRYLIAFLPAICCAYLLYGPLTMGMRYLGRNWGDLNLDTYLTGYLFNVRIYAGFLIPTLLFSYVLLLYNLYQNIATKHPSHTGPGETLEMDKKEDASTTLEIHSNYRKVQIQTLDICWIEKRDRKVFLKTDAAEISISSTLADIEFRLPTDHFFRVNRSAIVARRMIKDYAFWENDKYILTTNGSESKEFTMSRKRMQMLRDNFLAMHKS